MSGPEQSVDSEETRGRMAQAWDQGWRAGWAEAEANYEHGDDAQGSTPNPYRSCPNHSPGEPT